MVDIPINNQNSIYIKFGPRIRCSKGNVIEDAITTGEGGFSVMTRGANNSKAIVQCARDDIGHELDERGCCILCRSDGSRC